MRGRVDTAEARVEKLDEKDAVQAERAKALEQLAAVAPRSRCRGASRQFREANARRGAGGDDPEGEGQIAAMHQGVRRRRAAAW